MKFVNIKSKNGFGLVECVIALLVFSIISGSVIGVFTTSRNQIKSQNDKYKIEITANNILSAFEGTTTFDGFSKALKDNLGITVGSGTDNFSQLVGTEGGGQYDFDINNVPVAVPFSKITVKKDYDEGKQYATFRNESDNGNLVAFEGTYPDNKLVPVEGFPEYNPSELYDEKEFKKITFTGSAIPSDRNKDKDDAFYNYTITVTDSTIKMKYGDFEKEHDCSSFDKYLFDNSYYLKYQSSTGYVFILHPYWEGYFQVYDAKTNQPVKDKDGNYLYYLIENEDASIVGITTCLNTLNNLATESTMSTFEDSHYFNLSHCTIKYKAATSFSEESNRNKYTELKDKDGKNFSGKWYFYPWLVYQLKDKFEPQCRCEINHEYTLKDEYKQEGKSSLYYALASEKNMLIFNPDDELIFAYSGNTSSALKQLKNNCNFGVDGNCNTKGTYQATDVDEPVIYDKWYQKGAVPVKKLKNVKFEGSSNALSKITFYDIDDKAYLSFKYDNYGDFVSDRNSIIGTDGVYSNNYNFTKTYSKALNGTITNKNELLLYPGINDILSKIAATSTEEQYLTYYTTSSSYSNRKYTYTYTYYTYKVILEKKQTFEFKETKHNLTESHNNGALNITESREADVKYKTVIKPSSVTCTAAKKTMKSSPTTSKTAPAPDLPGATKVSSFTTKDRYGRTTEDYTDASWVKTNKVDIKTDWNSTVESSDKYKSEVTRENLPDDMSVWSLSSTSPAELSVKGLMSSLKRDENAHFAVEIKVGESDDDVLKIFSSTTDNFEITAGDFSADTSSCTYDIVGGDLANVEAVTYYISYTSGDMKLIAACTFSNYTKFVENAPVITEPRMTIWSLPKNKAPSDENIKNILGDEYSKYIYCTYRKG